MKVVRLETTRLRDGAYKIDFIEAGVVPKYPSTIDKSGEDVAIGKVSEEARFFHHIDRNDTRYLIYLKGEMGVLNGNEVFDLENALDRFLDRNLNFNLV